jgi:hypothetical protein
MRAREFITESKTASAEAVWNYVKQIHPDEQQGGGYLRDLIMRSPRYELHTVPLSSLHIPDQEYDDDEDQDGADNDPYNRVMFVDPDHAGEHSQHYIDRDPIVVDAQGYILDGNHRAWAAAELLGRDSIQAWVPVESVTESTSDWEEIEEFIDELTPDDVGVEEFGDYRVHFEGFTDDCQSSSDYQEDPEKVFQQVFADFVARENGGHPIKQGIAGNRSYPILYSVFQIPQSKHIAKIL